MNSSILFGRQFRGRLFFAAAILGASTFLACGRTGEVKASAVPRTSWGEPDLAGVWKLEKPAAQDPFDLLQLEKLYTPAARERMKTLSAGSDPILNCGTPPFPRALNLGTPIQIAQTPGFMVTITEAFASYRIVPTNGRPHLSDDVRLPRNLGSSTARWDGDTLVVDVISFSDDAWLAGRADKPPTAKTDVWPVSDAAHMVERWRRADADTLEYQARLDDPEMLSSAWETPRVTLKRLPSDRVEENLCLVDDGPPTYLERVRASR